MLVPRMVRPATRVSSRPFPGRKVTRKPEIQSPSISFLQIKNLSTEPNKASLDLVKGSQSNLILKQQRHRRPLSPHLSIYRMSINYFTSPMHRITGVILSGTLYCFAAAYLISPFFGWPLDSAAIAAAFGSLPMLAKIATKFAMALPFTFHSVNGVGHLVWDTGRRLFSVKAIARQGWTIVGVSVAGTAYLAAMV